MKSVTGSPGAPEALAEPAAFRAVDPVTGQPLEPAYASATQADVDEAVDAATRAFGAYADTDPATRARFLRAVADRLDANADGLVARARAETALPEPRLRAETARTANQFRLFADAVADGAWMDARIDHADPGRTPPRPDVRSILRPLGPVAVFGAANFPLAFSVPGGDTAAALAAGCPVVAKAHPSHPGTSQLAGECIARAAVDVGLPAGVFSLLFDAGHEVGLALVRHPGIAAVAFTGSRAGGMALAQVAGARPVPVPVFAEMGSTNPVFVLPGAARERGDAIAQQLFASFTLGAGQYCTKPGVVFVPKEEAGFAIAQGIAEKARAAGASHLLSERIRDAFARGVAALEDHAAVTPLAEPEPDDGTGFAAAPHVFFTDAASFLAHEDLAREVFGPAVLLVAYDNPDQLEPAARSFEGQLTGVVHAQEDELAAHRALLTALEARVGRLILNGVPTGVEVVPSMVHGGPFPATLDGRSTSVGTRAMVRFTRCVAYQDFPESVLPPPLQASNPWNLLRMVNGSLER